MRSRKIESNSGVPRVQTQTPPLCNEGLSSRRMPGPENRGRTTIEMTIKGAGVEAKSIV